MRDFKVITVKFAGTCRSCGGRIEVGQTAVWNRRTRHISHEVDSVVCAERMKAVRRQPVEGADDFDMLVEDRMAEACGLTGRDN